MPDLSGAAVLPSTPALRRAVTGHPVAGGGITGEPGLPADPFWASVGSIGANRIGGCCVCRRHVLAHRDPSGLR